MNGALLVARRELAAYVRSPLGSIIIAAALLLNGILFYVNALSKRLIELDGERELTRAFPDWLALSHFATVRGTYQAQAASA